MFCDLGRPTRRTTPAGARGKERHRRQQAAFEIAFISLAQARELVELYAENGDPKVSGNVAGREIR